MLVPIRMCTTAQESTLSEAAEILSFTATTSRGQVVEFQLPLHPHTSSREQVGSMLEGLLDAMTTLIDSHDGVSDGDLLQALALAMAVRMGVAGIGQDIGRTLLTELVEAALAGAATADRVSTRDRQH